MGSLSRVVVDDRKRRCGQSVCCEDFSLGREMMVSCPNKTGKRKNVETCWAVSCFGGLLPVCVRGE